MFSVCQAAVFLLLICPRVATDDTEKVVLEIRYLPILFGEDAYLDCNLSSFPDCCSNTVIWKRNQYIIINHGVSVNNLKYTQVRIRKGFRLQINNFESRDINVAYSCLYKFKSDSRYLQINEYDFEMLPSASNTFINTTVHPVFHKIIAELLFEKVFPRPNCTLLADNLELETVTAINWSMNGLFYRTTIVLTANYTTDMCGRSINVICIVGRNKRINNLDSNRTINCSETSDIQQTSFTERSYQSSIITSIASLLVFTASLVITGGIYRFRKHKNRRRSIENDEEKIPLLAQNVFCQNAETEKTAGSTSLRKAVLMLKSLPLDQKYMDLVESNKRIWKQMKAYKDQGKYDENRGNGLFPPRHRNSRNCVSSIPFQKANDLKKYFMHYVQEGPKRFSSKYAIIRMVSKQFEDVLKRVRNTEIESVSRARNQIINFQKVLEQNLERVEKMIDSAASVYVNP